MLRSVAVGPGRDNNAAVTDISEDIVHSEIITPPVTAETGMKVIL